MKNIILASQSVNRRRLLEQIGLQFEVIPSNYEEDMTLDMPFEELAMFLSKGKADDVAKDHPNSIIIAADTFFVHNNKVAGKPHSDEEAFKTLQALRGQKHTYVTGFTIIDTETEQIIQDHASVDIWMRADLTDQELKNYIANEVEPVTTKAGGYDGMNLGAILIDRMEGDWTTSNGLPLSKLAVALQKVGVELL